MLRTVAEIEQAVQNARNAWKDTGDPFWSIAEGALAWALGSDNVDRNLKVVFEKAS